MSHSHLFMPECIHPEAWKEGDCVVRQTAATLEISEGEVEAGFDNVDPKWRERGASC